MIPILLATALTLTEQRGQEIYVRGTSGRGTAITAVIGEGGPELPASAVPCASCHRANGRGQAEGGVTPARIDWETLTRDLDTGSRHRPPYTAALLRRAITMGIDSGGNTLQSAMPRYRFRRDDIDDLVAYIMKLSGVAPPGVHDDAVRIGVVSRDASVLATLQASAKEVRLYDRRVVFEAAQSVDESADVFAWVDINPDPRRDVPQIALAPQSAVDGPRFALFAGMAQQAAALLRVAAKHLAPAERTLMIAGGGDTAEALKTVAAASGWTLSDRPHATLLLDGSVTPKTDVVLVPAMIAAPSMYDERGRPRPNVFVALPSAAVPGDFLRQSAALAGALVVEALTRGGRELTRDGFVLALESIHDFGPSLLSFSHARHVGSDDVTVVWHDGAEPSS
jgi:Cytochrome c